MRRCERKAVAVRSELGVGRSMILCYDAVKKLFAEEPRVKATQEPEKN